MHMRTVCSCETDAFEVSIFLRAGVWVFILKKIKIRFKACCDKEHESMFCFM